MIRPVAERAVRVLDGRTIELFAEDVLVRTLVFPDDALAWRTVREWLLFDTGEPGRVA